MKTKAPDTCDKCDREQCSTMYDWEGELICLTCIPDYFKDSLHPSRIMRVINAAVTGEIPIEKRRRAIQKRVR